MYFVSSNWFWSLLRIQK